MTTPATEQLWHLARHTGAPSIELYHDALAVCRLVDAGTSSLTRARTAIAVLPTDADDDTVTVGELFGILEDVERSVDGVRKALTQFMRLRRRARQDVWMKTPANMSRRDILVAARVCCATGIFDAARNPLIGALAGTPEAATRALLDREPLFRTGVLVTPKGTTSLDDVAASLDAIRTTLLTGFEEAATTPTLLHKTRTRLRR